MLEEMQVRLREVANDETLNPGDPKWFSYTGLSMGLTPGLQDGRILLASDVGNPILPNDDQGMNIGITDAFNLGWNQALLQTYNTERHAVRSALQNSPI